MKCAACLLYEDITDEYVSDAATQVMGTAVCLDHLAWPVDLATSPQTQDEFFRAVAAMKAKR